ncbi:TM9 protein A [Tieghemostelium lacteum]|uniref:Transmembrane 9 superfamily member n=1 Tax=Tieghemostelium lacteum TaxID=361077 RepID=A0A152A1Q3_TIELA|nr:TM9 protein A [Tieghemostelium lacteum]|eukprot:KYR00183.1 TM9 protein A [Tieghemostelium lacteum]
MVKQVSSPKGAIPYSYYTLPGVCLPALIEDNNRSLGNDILGKQYQNTLFQINYGVNVDCATLNIQYPKNCPDSNFSSNQVSKLRTLIDMGYLVTFIVDDHPINRWISYNTNDGIPFGEKTYEGYVLYNHLKFDFYTNNGQIFKSTVNGDSYQYELSSDPYKKCPNIKGFSPIVPPEGELPPIIWTYSVSFTETQSMNIPNESVSTTPHRVRWFSLLNSFLINIFLGIIVWMAYGISTNKPSFLKYYQDNANAKFENGWRLIHGDVFRQPRHSMILSSLVGMGTQFIVVLVLLFLNQLYLDHQL